MTASTSLDTFRVSGTTLANHERDFTGWHQGRPFYYCWAIMLEDAGWLDAARCAADSLRPWLVPAYERQGHVTILPAGFPGQPIDRLNLSRIAQGFSMFVLQLGPLGSFTSSPCFEVRDPASSLVALRRALRTVFCDPASRVGDEAYQPHVTVGLYRDRFSTEVIARRIEKFPAIAVGPIEVSEIALCAYESHTIKGPLIEVATLSLESGTLRIRDHEALFQ